MQKWPVVISISFIALLVVAYFAVPLFQSFINEAFAVLTSNNQERIEEWVRQFKLAGPAILILFMVIQMFLIVVPTVFLMLVAIIMYGPVWGAAICLIGVFASSSVGYAIGRYLGPATVHKLIGDDNKKKVTDFLHQYGVIAIAIIRLSSLSNDSLSIVAGLLKMHYRKFILATFAGVLPLVILLAIFQQQDQIKQALMWIAGISLAILIIYIVIDKKKKKKDQKEAAAS